MTEVPSWHVLADKIREEDTIGDVGQGLIHVHIIPYRIDSGPARGQFGEIRVPDEDYTPDTVEGMINAKTATTHAIGGLKGGNP
jgi:hypothetical protein